MLKRWTEGELDDLWRMYRGGATNTEISVALGRSVPSVAGRLALLKRRERTFSS